MAYGGYTTGYPPSSVAAFRATTWAVAPPPPVNVTATRGTTWRVLASRFVTRATSWTVFSTTTTTTFVPAVRFKVYAPNGAVAGRLPTPSGATITYPLNDVGALSFGYSMSSPNVDLLGAPVEIAAEMSPDNGVTWIEPPDSRFLYLTDGRDPVAPVDSIAAECKGYVWRLSKARVLPGPVSDEEGNRPFASVSAGTILTTLTAEAQARGALAGMTFGTFDQAHDSAGAPWASTLTISYSPGLDYLAVLLDLVAQGFVDFRMVGRDLRVYNADTVMAQDRTTGSSPVVLRSGRDLTEAPFRRTWEGLANYAYFAGDKVKYEQVDPLAETPWGRQEIFISNGNISDVGTMAALSQQQLSMSEQERIEYTHGLTFVRATFRPFWEYGVGDFILSVVKGSTPIPLRIRQLTLTVAENGVLAGNVVLNDRFLEADVRAQRKIDGITGGATGGPGSGTPVPPDNPTPTSAPAKVLNLSVSSAAYLGVGGFAQAQVALSWSPVTTNVLGNVTDAVERYEVYQRPGFSVIADRRMVTYSPDTNLTMSPYVCGTNWIFSVRAVNAAGVRGAFSDEVAIAMANDVTPPQAPSTPTLTNRLGLLAVKWDGNPATGAWPADFDHVEVHMSTVNNFTPDVSTMIDQLYGVGTSIIQGQFGVTLFIRLVAVDTSRLKSVPSVQASGAPSRLVGSDLDPDAITYEQIGFKDPGNVILDGSFETPTYRGAVEPISGPWTFTTSDATHGSWSALINAGVGTGSRQLQLMDAGDRQQIKATEKLFVRMAYKGSAGATGTLQCVVEWTLTSGATSTTPVIGLVKNGVWQQIAAQCTAPANTASFRVYVELTSTGTTGTYYVDAVEVRRTINTSIIEDAAIGNAQIANLAVNSAKISDLDVGKLTAGSMTADVLVAGRIMTATAGNRLEMSGTGLRLYDQGSVSGHWDPLSGKLMIYNTADASLVSDEHGMQFGPSTGRNLIIDDNEIMSRFNGTRATLSINREGGAVVLGGTVGGAPVDGSGIPANNDHRIVVAGSLQIQNARDGDYADEFSPLLVGPRAGQHLWMDGNEFGSSTGDGVGNMNIMPPSKINGNHTSKIYIASNALQIFRMSTANAAITALDGPDVGIQFSGSNGLLVRTPGLTGYREIHATSFVVESAQEVKSDIASIDALAIVKKAPGKRWKYRDHVEPVDRWHAGPMAEDLPEDFLDTGFEGRKGYDVAALNGILWEAVRQLSAKVDQLEKGGGNGPAH